MKLHVVVYQVGAWWVAVGLEHCLSTQSKTLTGALQDFERMLQGQIQLATERNKTPLENFPPAEKEEWDRFAQAQTVAYSLGSTAQNVETRIAA